MSSKMGDFVWDQSGFLGEGSFGKVYKGKNVKTNEIVAIKCMDMSAFTDKFMLDSLKNEINVMKQLKSDNVVKLFDVLQDNKYTYIILEFCPDGDLNKFIKKNQGSLQEKIAIDVLIQLMHGFKELVGHGYIHRDIKPANSLVKGNIHKVADFGFAAKVDITGRQLIKECVGTPLYMAPQLLENRPYTAKSDIWSIGMMFYEMIFGKSAWPCRDLNSFLRNMKTTPLRFPYEKPITNITKDFITRCLVVDEQKRISWEEIFKHQILQEPDKGQMVKQNIQLDQQAVDILRRIQEMGQINNFDYNQIFQHFDQKKDGFLNYNEFTTFLMQVDPRMTSYEIQHVFQSFDTKKDGKIDIKEFREIFVGHDFCNLKDKASHIITDLKEIIKANNIDIKQIFYNFDKDKGGSLDVHELGQLLRKFAPALKDDEILNCFQKFDNNKDGQISFDEFYRCLSYGMKQDSKYNPFEEKAKKLIGFLKKIIIDHKLNLIDIFKNFDKQKNGTLDLGEFTKMMQVIDKNIPHEECKYIFQLFDKSGDGDISFDEFSQYLK